MKENHKELQQRYFIIHKPYGYLSQFINNGRKKNSKKLLGALFPFPDGVMSVGRLDEKSEGLLLITTDGKLSNKINSSGVEKEYYAQLDGLITHEVLQKLSEGIEISIEGKKYYTKPCKAFKLEKPPNFPKRLQKLRDDRHGPTCWVSITLTEGKFRQVRKMTAAVGFPTLRLIRIRVGDQMLHSLKSGEVKEVSSFLINFK